MRERTLSQDGSTPSANAGAPTGLNRSESEWQRTTTSVTCRNETGLHAKVWSGYFNICEVSKRQATRPDDCSNSDGAEHIAWNLNGRYPISCWQPALLAPSKPQADLTNGQAPRRD